MKKSPLPRSTTPIRRSAVRKQSAKQRAKQDVWGAITRELITEADGMCTINSPACVGIAKCAHHVIKRSAGGPDTKDNGRACCYPCNLYIEDHPAWGLAHGHVKLRSDPVMGRRGET